MKSTREKIQTVTKLGEIFSRIVWICAIVGAALCLVGLVSRACGVNDVFKLGGVTIHGILSEEGELTDGQITAELACGLIFCAAELVVAWFAVRYFRNAHRAGTVFTREGAGEIRRLGILAIAVTAGAQVLAGIVSGIAAQSTSAVSGIEEVNGGTISIGIMFLVMSLIFTYGTELEEKNRA